ncbi:MAG: PspC domain-containing protein [Thermoprotei archaeon]|nr:MAG: PspC domain-containing protein [Thermoprotei archaeon]
MKRLYRSRKERILGGVCGGLGKYFNVDPNIIRLLWIAFTLFYGIGVLLYILAWIIIPEEPGEEAESEGGSGRLLILAILIVLLVILAFKILLPLATILSIGHIIGMFSMMGRLVLPPAILFFVIGLVGTFILIILLLVFLARAVL